jgi:hypothetical protein
LQAEEEEKDDNNINYIKKGGILKLKVRYG